MRRWLWCLALCAGCAAPGDLVFEKALVEFGPALRGVERYERIELINNGSWPVSLKEARSTNPNFWIVFPPKMKLSPHQPQLVTVRHLPPEDATEPEEADLELWTEEEIVATLHSSSLPVAPDCGLPEALDFGSLSLSETATFRVPLRNSTDYPSGAMVDDPYTTHDAFRVTAGWVPLAPGEEARLPISFTPWEARNYTAAVPIRPHPLCPVQLLRVLGEGSTHPLSVQPSTLGWFLPQGDSEVQAVTLVNRRTKPVQLSNVQVHEDATSLSVFQVTRFPVRVPAAQRDAFNQLMPGEATIEVSFTAQGPEARVGVLTIETDIAAQPELVVNLRGSGF